jgi:hypothetical protein
MIRKSYPHHVSLYLDSAQHRQLQQLVKRTGRDASKHLRTALALYLEQQSKPKRPPKSEPPAQPTPTRTQDAVPTGEVLPIVLIWGD